MAVPKHDPTEAPKMTQHRSKMGQHNPKMAQHRAKMGQHGPKLAQHRAKLGQHGHKMGQQQQQQQLFFFFFFFFFPRPRRVAPPFDQGLLPGSDSMSTFELLNVQKSEQSAQRAIHVLLGVRTSAGREQKASCERSQQNQASAIES